MRSHRSQWHRGAMALLVVPFLAIGCESNPTEVHDEELTVELTLSSDHVHILTPVTFTALVREGSALVTDMDTVRVERRLVGSTDWRKAADLQLVGSQYVGEYTFVSSGEYELRVQGLRAGHTHMEEIPMAMAMDHVEAVPAHAEAGGYRVEFESFPGHIHEGNEVTFKFWIKAIERDPATNERPPISGIEAEIACEEPDGSHELHVAEELVSGEYTAVHTFASVGDGVAEIRFTGADGTEATASFDLHIVHAH